MNHNAPLNRFDLLLSILMIVIVVVVAGGMGVYVLSDPGIRAGATFLRAAQAIETYWVEPVPEGRIVEAARDSMLNLLDRFSGYVGKTEFDQMREELSGGYGGIGISIVPHHGGLLIMSVREGAPAARVGLQSGDVIIGADSVSFEELTVSEASRYLRGEPGTSVLVRVYHPIANDTTEFALTRERVPLVHVPFAGFTESRTLYIRVLDFDAGAADDIRSAVDSLLDEPGFQPAGIILDLRSNPGGLFTEAYRTANIFLDPGKFIVGTDARSRWNEETHRSLHEDRTNGLPMAIIVNGGSASAAEIVAGALQQSGRAVLVGDTTFGKGLVQGFIGFPDGDGLRLTISRYYFDHGVYLNRFDSSLADTGSGLVPDYYYAYPELNPYVQALENSLLLQQFAYRNLEDILAEDDLTRFGPILGAFAHFLSTEEFTFRTLTTEAARDLARQARDEDASAPIRQLADQLVRQSEEFDQRLLFEHAPHIALRLRQIAFEREYGAGRTYKEVILPNRGDIRLAEEILLNRRS